MPELSPLRYELLDVRVHDGQVHLRYRDRERMLSVRLRRAGAYLMYGLAFCGAVYGAPPPFWYRTTSHREEQR